MSPDKHKRKKRPTLKLGSWNVRTMTTGMDPENINDARKTAIINNELLRLKVDIAALQEQGCHTLRELRETQGIFKLKKI